MIRTGIPPRPETWGQLCGWYGPDPGPVTNMFFRALFGAGAEVTVRRGHLTMTPLTPVPAMRHGMRLHQMVLTTRSSSAARTPRTG